MPEVLFNRRQNDERLSSITSDNVAGGAKVADHFLACGRRRIAHISGWSGSSTGRDRREGFVSRLAERGVEPVAVIDGMYDRDVAIAATRTLFDGPDAARPDAIFVGSDHMAFAVMDTLRSELRLRVPEDVAVVGYDDVPMAGWPAYDLTTVRQSADAMVDATVETLMTSGSSPYPSSPSPETTSLPPSV